MRTEDGQRGRGTAARGGHRRAHLHFDAQRSRQLLLQDV